MHFQVNRRMAERGGAAAIDWRVYFDWTLHKKSGPVARSAEFYFETEQEARADIAKFKQTAGAARMAKVLSP